MGRPIKVSNVTRFKFGKAITNFIEYDLQSQIVAGVDFGNIKNVCLSIEPYVVRKEA